MRPPDGRQNMLTFSPSRGKSPCALQLNAQDSGTLVQDITDLANFANYIPGSIMISVLALTLPSGHRLKIASTATIHTIGFPGTVCAHGTKLVCCPGTVQNVPL